MDVNREECGKRMKSKHKMQERDGKIYGMASLKSQMKKPMEDIDLRKSGCQILLCQCLQTSHHS